NGFPQESPDLLEPMAKKEHIPVTAAVRELRAASAEFTVHLYDYVERGGTRVAAEQLQLDEHLVIKTVVFQDEQKQAVIVLQHGDKEISTKSLSRILERKRFEPCSPETVTRLTGYLVGGTSPFGLKQKLPVYMERSIAECETIYLNGGKRGFLVGISPQTAISTLKPVLVEVAV
ncbi:MAG: hypothetical protein KDD44_14540, partial [Bdellovibrionales bacterium]|nr:hypothetical protein [Bdellovibrionales bacterium]